MREATKEERELVSSYIESISQKAIITPNGATNGDVMKALFGISLDDFKHKWAAEILQMIGGTHHTRQKARKKKANE